tara:strand:+ start:17210 stop:17443 length:234 start_codon:yes stop_codon:yes gene_type:complete
MKCYEYNKKHKKSCEVKKCRYWVNCKPKTNCCINIAQEERETKLTLQDIGAFFNVTRMRICQIEKIAIQKLRDKLDT